MKFYVTSRVQGSRILLGCMAKGCVLGDLGRYDAIGESLVHLFGVYLVLFYPHMILEVAFALFREWWMRPLEYEANACNH